MINHHVLFIEDNIDIIESLIFAFSFYWPEAEIIPAHLGQAGLEIARQKPIDAIILDLGLPDMDGRDVLVELKKITAAPVIILSARIEEEVKPLVMNLGASGCIFKPFKQQELIKYLKNITGKTD